jgi:acyl-coenzyme A synthetase/AMP-(fatty) acid ligase
MEHANIADCAVVGVADEVWGQRVAAAVVWRDPSTVSRTSYGHPRILLMQTYYPIVSAIIVGRVACLCFKRAGCLQVANTIPIAK